MIHFVQRQIALTGDCHAQGTVTEHFNTNLLSARTADILFPNLTINLGHLFQIQLTGQHYDIGKLGVELQGFRIRYIQLSRQVYFLTDLTGIVHYRYIGSNHR